MIGAKNRFPSDLPAVLHRAPDAPELAADGPDMAPQRDSSRAIGAALRIGNQRRRAAPLPRRERQEK